MTVSSTHIQSVRQYLRPKSLDEALQFAEKLPEFKFMAGGTDIVPDWNHGHDLPTHVIDISDITSLSEVCQEGEMIRIGSMVRLSDLPSQSLIGDNFPVLIQAAQTVGSPLIRQMATLGGNVLCENRCIFFNQSEFWRAAIGYCLKCDGDICIAAGTSKACYSEFVSDTAPALICLNAQVEILNPRGLRRQKLEEIYTFEGVNPRNLGPDDILTAFLIPVAHSQAIFKKLRQRESLEFAALNTAMSLDSDGNIKIVVGGVDPGPVIVEGHRDDPREELIRQAWKKSRAIENNLMGRKYRKEMIKVYLADCFRELLPAS